MKNKILMALAIFLLPVFVMADSISVNCPSEVSSNSEFSCELMGYTETNVTDLSIKFRLSSNLTFVTFIKGAGWNGEGDLSGIDLYSGDGFKENFRIGILKFKSGSSSGTITLSDIIFFNDSKSKSIPAISKTISVRANQSSSSSKPSSSSSNTNNKPSSQSTKPSSSSSKPSSSSGSSSASSSGGGSSSQPSSSSSTGNENNDPSGNENIPVGDGIDYQKGAFLSDIKIKGYELDFRTDIFSYTLKIGNEKKLKITPVPMNKDVTYEIFDNEDLKDGSQIYIEVKYKDEEDFQTYYINITKDKTKRFTPVFVIIIVILVIFNIVRILLKRKKNSDE